MNQTRTSSRPELISTMRNRLFDFTKRNRNLFLKERSSDVILDISELDLSKEKVTLDFGEDELLANSINRLRIKALRNERELGFSNLKLVHSTLSWVVPGTTEPVVSPLFLQEVELKRKRGITERIDLHLKGDVILNPVLLRFMDVIAKADFHDFQGNSIEDIVAKIDGRINLVTEDTPIDQFNWTVNPSGLIGNFDFSRMTLLKDYDVMLENGSEPVHKSKNIETGASFKHPAFNILPSDDSQDRAIFRLLNEENLILQGPPGTGKSQTLTNAIANFVAKGKRVLLVSDKRSALDVVYQRLKDKKLGSLVAPLHDSKSDRKELIKGVKKAYSEFLNHEEDLHSIKHRIGQLDIEIDHARGFVDRYKRELNAKCENGYSLRELYQRCNKLKPFSENVNRPIPGVHVWDKFKHDVEELDFALNKLGYTNRTFAQHPAANLSSEFYARYVGENQITILCEKLDAAEALAQTHSELKISKKSMPDYYTLYAKVRSVGKIIDQGCTYLLNKQDKRTKTFVKNVKRIKALKKSLKALGVQYPGWKQEFPLGDLDRALEVLNNDSFWPNSWRPAYRRLVRRLESKYNRSEHLTPPNWETILEAAREKLALTEELKTTESLIVSEHGIQMYEATYLMLSEWWEAKEESVTSILLKDGGNVLIHLYKSVDAFDEVYRAWSKGIRDFYDEAFESVISKVRAIHASRKDIITLIPLIERIAEEPELLNFYSLNELTNEHAEFVVLNNEINSRLELNYWLKDVYASNCVKHLATVSKLSAEKQKLNAELVKELAVMRFKDLIALTETPAIKLSEDEKAQKKELLTGRRLLEREMSKTRQFKSLRELIDLGAWEMLNGVKSVWMMSPHSISENLPLTELFDVILFDEASQVKLEEGIPVFARGRQIVIVGDEMQLPPTAFFAAKDKDDYPASLLAYYSNILKQERLLGHYRSHNQKLIELSNKWFYDGELISIPPSSYEENPLRVDFVEDAVYENRINKKEAKRLVTLIKDYYGVGERSIGIVAFSKEQQANIESFLESIDDDEFQSIYDELNEYYQEGEYQGLFIKNLESVQGDERDVILISTAYGYDRDGRFLQQFGPVSQEGGERRLNVLFTRARKVVHVVTSMTPSNLTSDQLGPKFLKSWMQMAEAMTSLNTDISEGIRISEDYKRLIADLDMPESIKYLPSFMARNWKVVATDCRTTFHKPNSVKYLH